MKTVDRVGLPENSLETKERVEGSPLLHYVYLRSNLILI